MRFVAVLLLLCGCDQVLGLQDVRAPADVSPDVDCAAIADEDRDCVADAVDNCPATPNPDQADSLEGATPDGVGDVCDPHPTDPHDTIAAFFSFLGDGAADMAAWPNEDPNSMTWSYPGDGQIVHASAVDTLGNVVSAATYESSELTVEAAFTFHAWSSSSATTAMRMQVGIDTPVGNTGNHCFVTPYNNVDAGLDFLEVEDLQMHSIGVNFPQVNDGDRVTLRLRRTLAGSPPQLACHATIGDTSIDSPIGTFTVSSPDHHVSVTAASASADVRYVVIYARTN